MAVPKKKTTSRRSKLRRSHDHLTAVNLTSCPKCGDPILPHSICSTCGYYKGREVVHVETKLEKKLRKDKKKEKKEE